MAPREFNANEFKRVEVIDGLTIDKCTVDSRVAWSFKEVLKAVGSVGSGYQPPSIELLRGRLLQDTVQHVRTSL
jgi:hypothetical protein